MKDPHAQARRELAACEREHAQGIRREIKGAELARRRAGWSKDSPLVYPTTIRCAFVDFIDYLEKSGQIAPDLADRATLER